MEDLYLSIDDVGIPHVTPNPITTDDIDVCPDCGCMELNTPEQKAMFPEKPK